MTKRSSTRTQAMAEAVEMIQQGKPTSIVVKFLVAKYLFATADAYSLANAAKYRTEHMDEMVPTDEERKED